MAAALGLAVSACIPKTAPTPDSEATPTAGADTIRVPSELDEQMKEWHHLAEHPEVGNNTITAFAIAGTMAGSSVDGLSPLLDVIEDPAASPEKKVFAVRSVALFLTPAYVPRLRKLLTPEVDDTTRACAAALLAELPTEEVQAILRGLLEDDDRRVRLSAVIGLARAGDPEMREYLHTMYREPDTNDREKFQIVLFLLETPDQTDVDVFEDAVQSRFVNVNTRADLVLSLGNLGDASSIDALERSKIHLTDTQYIDQVDTAIAAIEARARDGQHPST